MVKKIISVLLVCIIGTSAIGIPGLAISPDTTSDDSRVGKAVDLNIIEVAPDGTMTLANTMNGENVNNIDYMKAQGWVPGATFFVGNKEYKVLDDYQIVFVGVDENMVIDNITDSVAVTRATNIPTKEGDLPYSGTYSIRNYMYTSCYWIVGSSSDVGSVGVRISPNSSQTIRVDWIDGRSDESMGSKTYTMKTDDIYQYVWVYGGEKFYLTLTNKGSYGKQTVSGAFDVLLDQVDAKW